jgi:hypothetical protein
MKEGVHLDAVCGLVIGMSAELKLVVTQEMTIGHFVASMPQRVLQDAGNAMIVFRRRDDETIAVVDRLPKLVNLLWG